MNRDTITTSPHSKSDSPSEGGGAGPAHSRHNHDIALYVLFVGIVRSWSRLAWRSLEHFTDRIRTLSRHSSDQGGCHASLIINDLRNWIMGQCLESGHNHDIPRMSGNPKSALLIPFFQ